MQGTGESAAPQKPPSDAAARIEALKNRKSAQKRHAAHKTRASALALSVLSTGGLAGYFAVMNQQGAGTSDDSAVAGSTGLITAAAPRASTPAAIVSESTNTTYADGVFAGTTENTRWGPVQVAVSIASDDIVSVDLLSLPNSDRRTQHISSVAGPALITDTLSVQSANVDIVSGATYTSRAYRDSLQAALDDAAAALADAQVH